MLWPDSTTTGRTKVEQHVSLGWPLFYNLQLFHVLWPACCRSPGAAAMLPAST